MSNLRKEEESIVKNFIKEERDAFAKKIARDEIVEIEVFGCGTKEPAVVRYTVSGSVDTKSPTGKSKIYKYTAEVDLNKEDGTCEIAGLKIDDSLL